MVNPIQHPRTVPPEGLPQIAAPNGTLIPLPGSFTKPGGMVSVQHTGASHYTVQIRYSGGLSHDTKSALRAIGVGTGVGAAKTAASRMGVGALLKQALGFVGGRVTNVIAGVIVPIETGNPIELNATLSTGERVKYWIAGLPNV